MKTDLFQCCGHCWVFQICWHIECSTFTASSFRIWKSSTGIPSPPLALFIVMLSKAHLTSHSRVQQTDSKSGKEYVKAVYCHRAYLTYMQSTSWEMLDWKKHKLESIKHNPDILECEVKWALGSITMNKASGGDGIPIELFQILKDDTVKVLHLICQQIWKTQQWPQDWKRSVFIPIPKKGNAKECSNYRTIALISHSSKVMLKILQARL